MASRFFKLFGLELEQCYPYNNCYPVIMHLPGYEPFVLHQFWDTTDGDKTLTLEYRYARYTECGRTVWSDSKLKLQDSQFPKNLTDEELTEAVIAEIKKAMPWILKPITK